MSKQRKGGSIRDLSGYGTQSKERLHRLAAGYSRGEIEKAIPATGMNRAMRRITKKSSKRRSPK